MRSASLKIRSQPNVSGGCAVDAEAAGAGVSVPDTARFGVRAEFVGDFFSAFWFSGDFVIAGDVIIETAVPSNFGLFC